MEVLAEILSFQKEVEEDTFTSKQSALETVKDAIHTNKTEEQVILYNG